MGEKSKDEAYKGIQISDYSAFSKETKQEYRRILSADIREFKLDEIKSSGYVVDTLEATLWCILNAKTYEEAVLTAVNLGSDTDTVSACTGGLSGILYGIGGILARFVGV